MAREFYDPVKNEWLTWRPLSDTTSRTVARDLGDEELFEIGAFGTCGDPAHPDYTSWRQEALLPVLKRYGVDDMVFNPEVKEWTPLRAPIESIHMARAAVLGVAVTNQTSSHASIMEAGFAAYGGVLRGQEVYVSIENDDESPEQTVIARSLAKSALKATAARYPLFALVDDIELLSHRLGMAMNDKKREKLGTTRRIVEYALPPLRTDLEPVIYLSGTSGARKPRWMKHVRQAIGAYDIPTDDSYRKKWDTMAMDEELGHKLNNGVHLIGITSETESYGALAELGPRLLHADLAGQAIGVYIEPHTSGPTSPSNRTRALAKEHLARLHEDFPHLPVFVAENLDQLAVFGMSEYFKQLQRRRSLMR